MSLFELNLYIWTPAKHNAGAHIVAESTPPHVGEDPRGKHVRILGHIVKPQVMSGFAQGDTRFAFNNELTKLINVSIEKLKISGEYYYADGNNGYVVQFIGVESNEYVFNIASSLKPIRIRLTDTKVNESIFRK